MEEKKGNLPVEEQGNMSVDTNNEVEESKENAELLLTFADFDTALAISSLLSLELMNVIRTVFQDDPESIQKVLTAVIKNVNASMEEITPEEIEPMDEFDDIPDETPIVYN